MMKWLWMQRPTTPVPPGLARGRAPRAGRHPHRATTKSTSPYRPGRPRAPAPGRTARVRHVALDRPATAPDRRPQVLHPPDRVHHPRGVVGPIAIAARKDEGSRRVTANRL